MGDYMFEKSKMYYEMFKKGKRVRKVCAVIQNDDKYLALIRNGKKATLIGGSVESGETTKQGLAREINEECGGVLKNCKYLMRNYYTMDWEFKGEHFPNKRIEYYYLCSINSNDLSVLGIAGEFEGKDIKLKWCNLKELEDFDLFDLELNLIKRIESEKLRI